MNKTVKAILCAVLLMAIGMSFGACSSAKNNPIDFEAKYFYGKDSYYVFHSDGTGEYYRKYIYEYEANPAWSYTLSGSVDFVWREASNGGVYLFAVETHYNEDHTEGYSIGIPDAPLYFSEDFFTYTTFSQNGDSVFRCLKEGSELENLLKGE